MKKTLVIFSKGSLSGLNVLEALSATLVMATYGISLNVCFHGDAISLLTPPNESTPKSNNSFKSAYSMVESFEFYDILPVWVWPQNSTALAQLEKSPIEHQIIQLDNQLLSQFDHVIYW